MEQRLSLVTLGVADLARARSFYERLGWSATGDPPEVVFFQAGGMVVALWDRAALAQDSTTVDSGGWGGVTLAHNVGSPAEVDAVIEEARAAGGDDRPRARGDVLGRLLGRLPRPRRPPVGGRAQPALDDRPRRRRPALSSVPNRSAAIDGIRGLAALSVLGFHVWLYRENRPMGERTLLFDQVGFALHLGLVCFFVLSGFLLYRAFARAALGGPRAQVGTYAIRRVARIVPAYYVGDRRRARALRRQRLRSHHADGARDPAVPRVRAELLDGLDHGADPGRLDALRRGRVLRRAAADRPARAADRRAPADAGGDAR